MLLCHGTLLFLGLHHAAFAAEILELAVKDGVFAELTFQRSVEHGNLDGWLQAYLIETFLAVAEHPGFAAHEGVLEPFAYHLVGAEQVGCGDSLAVGRIHHNDTLLLGLLEVLEVALLDGHILGKTGCFDVECGCVHGLDIYVVAVDMMGKLAFL